MSEYTLAVYVWSLIAGVGLVAPLMAALGRSAARLDEAPVSSSMAR
jgi:hypothetical protein